MTKPAEDREALSGVVERVVFHNEENGFAVLRVRVRGSFQPATVVGRLPLVSQGETIRASGAWKNDPNHGVQFRADRLAVSPPDSLDGIRRYLGSGRVHGVGPKMAKRLVKAFGEDVFEVIENEPERLKEVPGIGPKRAKRLSEGFKDQKAVREIMVFLQTHGLGSSRAARIYRTYGADAATLLTEDPYRLARDIRGIGFRIADSIGASLGKDPEGLPRARAGLGYTLEQARGAGHCGLPRDELLEQARELLKIPEEILVSALSDELQAGRLVATCLNGEEAVFLPPLLLAERAITRRLGELLRAAAPPWADIDAGRALAWVEKRLDVTLAPTQRAAVETSLRSRVAVITGGPGVGKTTLVNALLQILKARNVTCALCAPTGRAAKRLAESTGHSAKTIHRLLEIDPSSGAFRRGRLRPLDCGLLVVDESSMVDVELMAALLQGLPAEGSLLLIGDADQLPSVGPGQVLRDLIDSGAIPVARLREIFRQADNSRIVRNAHRVNQGYLPELESARDELSDFYFVPADDAEDGQRKVVEIVAGRIGRRFGLDPVRDVQVLSPMNRGPLGVRTLNVTLQAVLNPAPESGAVEVERFGWKYRAGDKVMQTENDYDKDVFNGDLGRIQAIDPGAEKMTIVFDGRPVEYRFSDLDRLMLAYAVTVHKSQGSEYPAVVVPVTTHHYVMLRRNLLYTAITRGRQLVVVVGQKWALQKAVEEASDLRRYSTLCERLAALASVP
ncbi:MAG: ATP-dependent RecD-like DNA helicase [Holophagales bacterium]|nr:ATP-dependent RecD-like DNA helicase [Holophagales bacterium]MYH26675.1 ATP-dependent RecD-like DNA helicase [Holophagales bacterium]